MPKINDIWKEKYGSTFSKKINITPNDNLYKMFKKTAKFIYSNGIANGDYDQKTEQEAIRHLNLEKDANVTPIDISHLTEKEQKQLQLAYKISEDELKGYHFYQMKYKTLKGAEQSKLLFVDPNNKTSAKDQVGYRWKYRDPDYQVTRGGFMKINQDLLIGYDKLQQDIDKNINLKQPGVRYLLEVLENPQAGKKDYQRQYIKDMTVENDENIIRPMTMDDFKEDSLININFSYLESDELNKRIRENVVGSVDKKTGHLHYWHKDSFKLRRDRNHAIDAVQNYINKTYNLTLQQDYENQLLKTSRAAFYQTKKNINKDAQEAMSNLKAEWKDYFNGIEIDNEVDLDKLKELKPEISHTIEALPKGTNGEKPILRFRKLRNHNALGIFTPANNTLAVDFRPNDGGGIGLRSFVHEYGHFLDFNSDTKDGLPKSLSKEFSNILNPTQAEINKLDKSVASSKDKAYLGTPSEVFARSFEVYASNLGMNNSLIMSPNYYKQSERYTTFTPEVKQKIFKYFDKEFPDLKRNIERGSSLKSKSINQKQEPILQSETKQETKIKEIPLNKLPEREIRRQAYLISKNRLHTGHDKEILNLKKAYDKKRAEKQMER